MSILPSERRLCECCREPGGSERRAKHGRVMVSATLCDKCATGGHSREACLLCSTGRFIHWRCTYVAHLAESHPGILQKIANDPFPELQIKSPHEYIGTLRF